MPAKAGIPFGLFLLFPLRRLRVRRHTTKNNHRHAREGGHPIWSLPSFPPPLLACEEAHHKNTITVMPAKAGIPFGFFFFFLRPQIHQTAARQFGLRSRPAIRRLRQ